MVCYDKTLRRFSSISKPKVTLPETDNAQRKAFP